MRSARRELVAFFSIAFGWMWLLNAPRVMAAGGIVDLSPAVSTTLGYLAVFGPGVAAFLLTGLASGREGVRALWRRGWSVTFSRKWFVPAALLMPAAGVATLLLLAAFGQPIAWENALPLALVVPIGLFIWLVGAVPEEYGWRGYALPRLLEKMTPLSASVLLGLVWGIWHLPLHFIPTTTQYVIPVWEYVLQTVLLAVIYTWLYLGTGGSILIAGIFHAMGNLTGALIPYWTTQAGRWISFGVLLVPAILLATRMKRSDAWERA
jgi:membrane protease YdiL (CAAX protease family)